jgi:hypothetical protein
MGKITTDTFCHRQPALQSLAQRFDLTCMQEFIG